MKPKLVQPTCLCKRILELIDGGHWVCGIYVTQSSWMEPCTCVCGGGFGVLAFRFQMCCNKRHNLIYYFKVKFIIFWKHMKFTLRQYYIDLNNIH